MQFYFFMPLWSGFVKKIKPAAGVILSFFITVLFIYYFWDFLFLVSKRKINFLYNDRILTSYFYYFIAGCYAGAYYKNFKSWVLKNIKIIAVLFIMSLIINTKISYEQFLGLNNHWIFELLHMIYCSFAILFCFWVCTSMDNYKNKLTNLLNIINQGSYYTYLSHCLIIIALNWLFKKIGIYSIRDAFLIKIVVVYFLAITSSYAYVLLKRKLLGSKQEKIKTLV
jgi:peptidoglycan/LPS O-acetylase OafA/YrhL